MLFNRAAERAIKYIGVVYIRAPIIVTNTIRRY